MDDHTYFILQRIERNIYRLGLMLGQLRQHVAELPADRSSEGHRRIGEVLLELDRECRIRAALLSPDPGSYVH
jgi:hypothetical protein